MCGVYDVVVIESKIYRRAPVFHDAVDAGSATARRADVVLLTESKAAEQTSRGNDTTGGNRCIVLQSSQNIDRKISRPPRSCDFHYRTRSPLKRRSAVMGLRIWNILGPQSFRFSVVALQAIGRNITSLHALLHFIQFICLKHKEWLNTSDKNINWQTWFSNTPTPKTQKQPNN